MYVCMYVLLLETQTTPRTSEELDHRDQSTQWSTPDLDHQQLAEDNMKKDTYHTPAVV